MSKKLFDDVSDEDEVYKDNLSINKSYADNYNTWRRKEEYQTLKDRYGEEVLDSDTSSEEEGPEPDNPEFDMDFFRVLAAVRMKHPVLSLNRKFFKDSYEPLPHKAKEEKKTPVSVRDHEMNLVLQNGGNSEDDNEPGTSYKRVIDDDKEVQLMNEKRKSAFKFEDNLPDDDDDGDNLFTMKEPAPRPLKDDDDSKIQNPAVEFLKGRRSHLGNKLDEELLHGLQEEWQTNMSEKDKYLMDFFVNQRYLEEEDEEATDKPERNYLLDFEPLDEDERTYDKMVEYETKYRFRFEEPDHEFVKKYPRMIKDTLRTEDTRRKEVRDKKKERVETEKERRHQEIQRMKALRRKEVMERIEALKQAAGVWDNALDFQDIDLDADFDPAAHDAAMSKIFNENYYQDNNGYDAEKPEDEELQKELEEEYAKLKELDHMPEETFKYAEVCPNSYGLTTEEILYAKDTELNQWYTMKKLMRQGKDENMERKEAINFAKRAEREDLKRKILPSLFHDNVQDNWKADEERKRKRNLKKKERRMKKRALEEGSHIESTTTANLGEQNLTENQTRTPAPSSIIPNTVNNKNKSPKIKKKAKKKSKKKTHALEEGSHLESTTTTANSGEQNLTANENRTPAPSRLTPNTVNNENKKKSKKKTKKKPNVDKKYESCNGMDDNTNNTQSKPAGNVLELDNERVTTENVSDCAVEPSEPKKKKRKSSETNGPTKTNLGSVKQKTKTNVHKNFQQNSAAETSFHTPTLLEKIEANVSNNPQQTSKTNVKNINKLKRKRKDSETDLNNSEKMNSNKKHKKISGNEFLGICDARMAAYGQNPKKAKKLFKFSKMFDTL